MNPKLVLCLALVLTGIYSAFAFAYSVQLKPGEMGPHSDILIRSKLDLGYRNYFVILLPQKDPVSNWEGNLVIYDGTNRLASCDVEGVVLSDIPQKGWDGIVQTERYMALTNLFSRPLNGAKLLTFEAATNLLGSSTFAIGERYGDYCGSWFYLKDFSNEK